MTLALSLRLHSNGVSSSLVPGHAPSSDAACVFSPDHFQHDLFADLFTSLCLARPEGPGGQGLVCFVQSRIPAPAAFLGLPEVLNKGMTSCE